MTRKVRPLVTAALVAGLTAALLAQTQTAPPLRTPPKPAKALVTPAPLLNVSLGLWQMTSTVTMGGDPPAFDTSKMSDAQKAQIAAAMKQMMASAATPHTQSTCLTKSDMTTQMFGENGTGETCTVTLNKNTTSVLDAEQTCTGDTSSHTTAHFEASSSTSISGTLHQTSTDNGSTHTFDATVSGKWVSSDCGKVK